MKLDCVTVLERCSLTSAQTKRHASSHAGRMDAGAGWLCGCVYGTENCMVFPSEHDSYLGLIM